MFFLEPVGTHVIDVCTNLACALRGAGEVLEAFEEELGVRVGGTTEDGAITLRKAECLGGCSWAPVVAVDERYREQRHAGRRSADRVRDPHGPGGAACLNGRRGSRPTSFSTSTVSYAISPRTRPTAAMRS